MPRFNAKMGNQMAAPKKGGGGFWGNFASGAGNLLGKVANSQFGQNMMGRAGDWAGQKIFGARPGEQQQSGSPWEMMKGAAGDWAQQRGMGDDFNYMQDQFNNFRQDPRAAMGNMAKRGMNMLDDHIAQNGFSNTMGNMFNKGQQFMNDPRGQMQQYGQQAMNYGKNQIQQYADDRGYSGDIQRGQDMYNQAKQAWNTPNQGPSFMQRMGQMADDTYMKNRPQQGYFRGNQGNQQMQRQGGQMQQRGGQQRQGGYGNQQMQQQGYGYGGQQGGQDDYDDDVQGLASMGY